MSLHDKLQRLRSALFRAAKQLDISTGEMLLLLVIVMRHHPKGQKAASMVALPDDVFTAAVRGAVEDLEATRSDFEIAQRAA